MKSSKRVSILVLGGEEPVDHQQRLCVREGGGHPLAETIMRIHIAEEARHISFARKWLEREIPKLGRLRRLAMSIHMPLTMGIMVRLMLVPGRAQRRRINLPKQVARRAYRTPEGGALLAQSASRVQDLAASLGLLNPVSVRLWKALRIWTEPTS